MLCAKQNEQRLDNMSKVQSLTRNDKIWDTWHSQDTHGQTELQLQI